MSNVYACSESCQAVHTHCNGCGVLSGPEHLYELREGLCYRFLEPHKQAHVAWRNCSELQAATINPDSSPCIDCGAGARGHERCSRCHHKHQMKTDPAYASNVRSLEATRQRRRRSG